MTGRGWQPLIHLFSGVNYHTDEMMLPPPDQEAPCAVRMGSRAGHPYGWLGGAHGQHIRVSLPPADDEKETVFYDDSGFPTCFDGVEAEPAPGGKEPAPIENLLPVNPRTCKRKAAAISARKDKAASNSSGGGGGGGDSLGCSKCRYSTRGCGRCRNR